MRELLQEMIKWIGQYEGQGKNHVGEDFEGEMSLSSLVEGKGLAIDFLASSDGGEILHEEHTIVALTPEEKLGLWTLSNNVPGLLPHELRRRPEPETSEITLVFGYGDVEDSSVFRQEITLVFWPSGDLTYGFHWGLPGSEFAPRSQVRLSPK